MSLPFGNEAASHGIATHSVGLARRQSGPQVVETSLVGRLGRPLCCCDCILSVSVLAILKLSGIFIRRHCKVDMQFTNNLYKLMSG